MKRLLFIWIAALAAIYCFAQSDLRTLRFKTPAAHAQIFGGSPPGFPSGVFQQRPPLDAAATPPWTPPSAVGSLKYWYKTDAGAFQNVGCSTPAANGLAVACWQDQSGNGLTTTQATGASQPTFVTSVINGLPGMHYVGASNTQSLNSAAFASSQVQPGMIFVGFVTTASSIFSNYETLVDNGSGSRAIFYSSQLSDNSGSFGGYDGAFMGSAASTAGAPLSISTPYYGLIVYNGTSSCVRLLGVNVTNSGTAGTCAGTSQNVSPNNLSGPNIYTSGDFLFLGGGAGSATDIYIVEVFLITGVNSSDASNGEAYLKSRMGL